MTLPRTTPGEAAMSAPSERRFGLVDGAAWFGAGLAIVYLCVEAPVWGGMGLAVAVTFAATTRHVTRLVPGGRPWEPLEALGSERVPIVRYILASPGRWWMLWSSPIIGLGSGASVLFALSPRSGPVNADGAVLAGATIAVAVALVVWRTVARTLPRCEYRLFPDELVLVDRDRMQRWPFAELDLLRRTPLWRDCQWSDIQGHEGALRPGVLAEHLWSRLLTLAGPAIAHRLTQRIEVEGSIAFVESPAEQWLGWIVRAQVLAGAALCTVVGAVVLAATGVAVALTGVFAGGVILYLAFGVALIAGWRIVIRAVFAPRHIGVTVDRCGVSGPGTGGDVVTWDDVAYVVVGDTHVELGNHRHRLRAPLSAPHAWALPELVARMKRA